ncbi:MAG: putative manganese transporter [Eubacteriales bacterium]
MGLFLDVFKDSAVDCVKMLPFLFLAFYLLEVVEQHASDRMTVMLGRSGGLGPLIGSLLGSVPQCGFSIMASDFFASGVISMGTLLAVYLSTSDEAIIILLTDPEHAKDILFLVLTKIIIGTVGGYIVLFAERRFFKRDPVKARKAAEIIRRRTGSDAAAVKPGFRDLLIPAWEHTKEVFVYLFIFTFLIGFMMEAFGNSVIESVFLSGSAFQPLVASVIGLIPNCAASIMLTQLYMDGVLSFGSAVAGLCSSAGLGLLVLFRMNRSMKENVTVLAFLVVIAVTAGSILQAVGLP